MPLLANRPKPRVILGLMTFGPDASAGARITSLTDYNNILDHFQAAGYNEVDTARAYIGGKQEAFTREAKWKDRGLTLATKVYPNKPGVHAPEVLTEAFNTSLKELGTDCVDIFYLHAPVCLQFGHFDLLYFYLHGASANRARTAQFPLLRP
jgi:aflatoxin B1 aldehyde reductase